MPAAAPSPYPVGFDADGERDLWGQTLRAVEAAEADTRAAQAECGDAQFR